MIYLGFYPFLLAVMVMRHQGAISAMALCHCRPQDMVTLLTYHKILKRQWPQYVIPLLSLSHHATTNSDMLLCCWHDSKTPRLCHCHNAIPATFTRRRGPINRQGQNIDSSPPAWYRYAANIEAISRHRPINTLLRPKHRTAANPKTQ